MCCTLESTLSNEELFLEQAFPRKSIVSENVRILPKWEKKMAAEEGNRLTSLLLVPSPLSFTCFIYSCLYDRGKLVTRKQDWYFWKILGARVNVVRSKIRAISQFEWLFSWMLCKESFWNITFFFWKWSVLVMSWIYLRENEVVKEGKR